MRTHLIGLFALCILFGCSTTTTPGGDTSVADAGDAGGDGGDSSPGDTGSDAADTGVDAGPVGCGANTCTTNEYCVVPCCGGAAPPCFMENPDGSCPEGTTSGTCGSGEFGCVPPPCTPPAPFCAPDDACSGGECPPVSPCGGGRWEAATRTYECVCA
jgi:hypothetical protein